MHPEETITIIHVLVTIAMEITAEDMEVIRQTQTMVEDMEVIHQTQAMVEDMEVIHQTQAMVENMEVAPLVRKTPTKIQSQRYLEQRDGKTGVMGIHLMMIMK